MRTGRKIIKLFTCSTQLRMEFSLLINMKMPTIAFYIYEQRNFHAQLFIARKNLQLDLLAEFSMKKSFIILGQD